VLVVGVAVPIAYVGLVGIWAMWNVSRQQLDYSIKTQAEIAGAHLTNGWTPNESRLRRSPLNMRNIQVLIQISRMRFG
jgi:hypothetical protein